MFETDFGGAQEIGGADILRDVFHHAFDMAAVADDLRDHGVLGQLSGRFLLLMSSLGLGQLALPLRLFDDAGVGALLGENEVGASLEQDSSANESLLGETETE